MSTRPPSVHVAASPVRYDYLDALRGWAILGVLAVHSVFAFQGTLHMGLQYAVAGRYGVQLFFMVSAYTIFLTLDRARQQGRQDWPAFFVRRFFRVLPLLWVGIVVYALLPGRASSATPLDYGLTALLQHGWHPGTIDLLVPGSWSVAAEGMFYLLVPLCHRAIRSWQAALWLLLGSLASTEAAFRCLAGLYNAHQIFAGTPLLAMQNFAYTWFPAQIPVFACGMLVYQLARAQQDRPWSRGTGALLLLTAGMGICNVVNSHKVGWLSEYELFALAYVPLILGLRACPIRLLVNPVTRSLGKISYSVYLLHFAVLGQVKPFVTWLHPPSPLGVDVPTFLLTWLFASLGTMPLAWLSYRYVEQPCIRLGARLTAHLRAAGESAGSFCTTE